MLVEYFVAGDDAVGLLGLLPLEAHAGRAVGATAQVHHRTGHALERVDGDRWREVALIAAVESADTELDGRVGRQVADDRLGHVALDLVVLELRLGVHVAVGLEELNEKAGEAALHRQVGLLLGDRIPRELGGARVVDLLQLEVLRHNEWLYY